MHEDYMNDIGPEQKQETPEERRSRFIDAVEALEAQPSRRRDNPTLNFPTLGLYAGKGPDTAFSELAKEMRAQAIQYLFEMLKVAHPGIDLLRIRIKEELVQDSVTFSIEIAPEPEDPIQCYEIDETGKEIPGGVRPLPGRCSFCGASKGWGEPCLLCLLDEEGVKAPSLVQCPNCMLLITEGGTCGMCEERAEEAPKPDPRACPQCGDRYGVSCPFCRIEE